MIINKHINLSPINIKLMSWSFLLSLDDIFGSSSKQQTSTMGHSTTSVSFDQVRKQIVVMITIFVLMCWPELINTCMLECLNGISMYKSRSSFPLSKVPTLSVLSISFEIDVSTRKVGGSLGSGGMPPPKILKFRCLLMLFSTFFRERNDKSSNADSKKYIQCFKFMLSF